MLELYKYTDKEMEEIINSIVILVDTREKVNEHITTYFDKAGIKWKKKKLDYGDYSFYIPKNEELGIERDLHFNKDIIIERKASLEEISNNLTKDRARFKEELALAPKNKVILLENCCYEDVVNGNYNTEYNAKSFWASIHSFWHKYNVPFVFIKDKARTGFFIRGYFQYYLRNRLNNY